MKPTCETCKFKVEWPLVNPTMATCIRNPPQIVVNMGASSTWPAITKALVCGEYKRRRWWHRTPTQLPPPSTQEELQALVQRAASPARPSPQPTQVEPQQQSQAEG